MTTIKDKKYRPSEFPTILFLLFFLFAPPFVGAGVSATASERAQDYDDIGEVEESPPRRLSEMQDFEQRLKDDEGSPPALIKGRKAVLMDDGTYHLKHVSIEIPLTYGREDEEAFDYAEITSRNAVIYGYSGPITMQDDVRGRLFGLDFSTDKAVLTPQSNTITAEGFIQMSGLPTPAPDAISPDFELFSGYGLTLNLKRRTVRLARTTKTEFGFMGRIESIINAPFRHVKVTSHGTLLYDHLRNNVYWQDNVRMEAGDMLLECDLLSMQKNWLATENISSPGAFNATGNVSFHFGAYSANGKSLDSGSSEGTMILSGQPAMVGSGAMKLLSQMLSINRREDHIVSLLPGKLLLLASEWRYEDFEEDKAPTAGDYTPIIWNGKDIEISWQGRMQHYIDNSIVRLSTGIVIKQNDVELHCDHLTLVFEDDYNTLQNARMAGNVLLGRRSSKDGEKVFLSALKANRMLWSKKEGTVAEHVLMEGEDKKHVTEKMVFDTEEGDWR